MKVELMEPTGSLTVDILLDTLLLVLRPDQTITRGQANQLTPLEQQIAYDWAIREHMHAAGHRVQRRAKPFGVQIGELTSLTYAEDLAMIGDQARLIAGLSAELKSCGETVGELAAKLDVFERVAEGQPKESTDVH